MVNRHRTHVILKFKRVRVLRLMKVGAGKYSKNEFRKLPKKLMKRPSKNREQGVMMVMKGLGTTYKHANQLVDKILGVNPKTGKIESAELDGEGYESEVEK